LKWAREQDCPFDQNTCRNAAEGGHLAVLRWLRELDCPWEPDVCSMVAGREMLALI